MSSDVDLHIIRNKLWSMPLEAWLSVALRAQKPYGSLGRKAPDGRLNFYTAPELWERERTEQNTLVLKLN